MKKTTWIAQTAVCLALLIAFQLLTRSLGQLVTGSCVNLVLAVAALLGGGWSCVTVALVSPFCAYLLGIGPAFFPLVSCVALGNAVYAVLFGLLVGKCLQKKQTIGAFGCMALAALAKFAVLYVVLVRLVAPVIVPAAKLSAVTASFTWPQLVTAAIGGVLAWIFKPLGWGNWQAAVASITGLVAKENIVGTLGILYGGGDGTVYQNIAQAFTGITGYSFLVFNLLCAPCFAAIGAIKREMNNAKWTWFAIGYQCGFAYVVALMINQFGNAFTGSLNVLGLIAAIAALALIVYMLFKPYKEATKLSAKV